MRKRLMFTGAAVVLGAAFAVAAPGDGTAGGKAEGKAARLERLRTEVGLTDDQIAQLQKMRSENRDRMTRQRAETRVARQQLQDLLAAPTVDEAAIQEQTRRLTDLEAAMTRDRVSQQLALREVLQPEQIEKLRAMRAERGKRGHGRRGFGRPGAGAGDAPAVQP